MTPAQKDDAKKKEKADADAATKKVQDFKKAETDEEDSMSDGIASSKPVTKKKIELK